METKAYAKVIKNASFAKKAILNHFSRNNYNITESSIDTTGFANIVYDSKVINTLGSRRVTKLESNIEHEIYLKEALHKPSEFSVDNSLPLDSTECLEEADIGISVFESFAHEYCSSRFIFNGLGNKIDITKDISLVQFGDYILGILNDINIPLKNTTGTECLIGLSLKRGAFRNISYKACGSGSCVSLSCKVVDETEDYYEIEYSISFGNSLDLDVVCEKSPFLHAIEKFVELNDNSLEYLHYREVVNT